MQPQVQQEVGRSGKFFIVVPFTSYYSQQLFRGLLPMSDKTKLLDHSVFKVFLRGFLSFFWFYLLHSI